MLPWLIRGAAILFETAITVFSIRRFEVLTAAVPLLETGQLSILFFFSLALTLLALFIGRSLPLHAFVLFLLKGLTMAFIFLLAPRLDLGLLPFFIAFNVSLGLGLRAVSASIVHGVFWLMTVSMAGVFHLRLGVDPTDLPLFLFSALLITGTSIGARTLFEKWEDMRRNEKRLADDVVRLITVNMDLQTFAMTVEDHALNEERKRISREIHDTVGYTLTTLKVLFEAAKGLVDRAPDQLMPLMDQGLEYTRNSMDEIREAMRDLRRADLSPPKGLHLITKLVDNFRSVTQMGITLEFLGVRHSYGREIDEFLYKGVQENLTNAYRHGKASRVSIFLQESRGELALMVRDNGQSSRVFVKGIGMKGMEERVAALGGTVEFAGNEYGFNVTARIPLPEGESA